MNLRIETSKDRESPFWRLEKTDWNDKLYCCKNQRERNRIMIYVIASIEVKEGAKEEFLKIFKANVPAVKAESGCIMYQPTVDFDSGMDAQKHIPDNVVTIIEGWACVECLKKHLASPHMLKYKEDVKNLVKGTTLNIVEPA
jgi:antibiotic biosynthesis monooxygenase